MLGKWLGLLIMIAVVIGPASKITFAQTNSKISPATNENLKNAPENATEILFWQSVKDSNNAAELRAYLDNYPAGAFKVLAEIRLQRLIGSQNDVSGKITKPKIRNAKQQVQEHPPVPPALMHVGYMGINYDPKYSENEDTGLKIKQILGYGTAKNSDLQVGDVIIELNETPVTAADLYGKNIQAINPGTTVKLRVWRGGKSIQFELMVGDKLELLWRGAHAGHVSAMGWLAALYYHGTIIERDYSQSRKWWEKAAAENDGYSNYALGEFHAKGRGVAKNDVKAFEYYLRSAELGYPEGLFWTAYLYGRGQGITKNNETAVYWYRKSAEQGNSTAMENLGIRHQVGRGVRKNVTKAADWYEKAIDAGNLNALSGLGYMYRNGLGGRKKDVAKAISLFRRAADKGNATGIYNLGLMYQSGDGVSKDRVEAIRLFRLAADGDDRAATVLKNMGETLYDPEEIQRLLSQLEFDPGKIDGKIGRKTNQAITSYQRQAGLAQIGKPSMELLKSLRKSAGKLTEIKVSGASKSATTKTTKQSSAGKATNNAYGDLSDLNSLD